MFKKANTVTSDKLRAEMESNPESEQDNRPRIKPRAGLNVYYAAFATGDMTKPCRHVMLHYNPFHLCNREDPDYKIIKGEEVFYTSTKFYDCPRCLKAWESYCEAGYEKGMGQNLTPALKKVKEEVYKPNLSDNKTLLQLIDLTPFFDAVGRKKDKANPNSALIKKWWKPFCEVLAGGEVPEDMPEDIATAAQAGLQIVVVNKTTGIQFHDAFLECLEDMGEDPTVNPDKFLLKIVKTEDSAREIVVKNGPPIKVYDYSVSFVSDEVKGWNTSDEIEKSGFVSYVESQVVDLMNLKADADDLKSRAFAMEKLSPDEMLDLCHEDPNHVWGKNAAPSEPESPDLDLSNAPAMIEDEEIPF